MPPITINPGDEVIFDGANPLKFPVDADNHPSHILNALTSSDSQIFLRATDDGRLMVDASVTVDNIDIGDVNINLKVGGVNEYWDGVLNPDATTHAGFVQDQRMGFTLGALDVNLASATSVHGRAFSTDPSGVSIVGVVSDSEIDFGLAMRDIDVVFDKDVVVKFSNAAGTPDPGAVVSLPAGRHFFDNQNSRYMFVTTTATTQVDLFANGGIS